MLLVLLTPREATILKLSFSNMSESIRPRTSALVVLESFTPVALTATS